MAEINFDKFSKYNSAYELIQSFDVEFDMPFKHGRCIGLLGMFGTYEQNDQKDELKLAESVGAWWCRIVRADVLYNLLDGLECIQASRADAEKLQNKILHQELNPNLSEIEQEAIAYMVTRWHDGAGKIYYRCADFTEARILFNKAIELAKQNNLWYCLPDIESNYLRADYQERFTAGGDRNIKLADAYKHLHEETINSAREHHSLCKIFLYGWFPL